MHSRKPIEMDFDHGDVYLPTSEARPSLLESIVDSALFLEGVHGSEIDKRSDVMISSSRKCV
jgi:hypothetical protein